MQNRAHGEISRNYVQSALLGNEGKNQTLLVIGVILRYFYYGVTSILKALNPFMKTHLLAMTSTATLSARCAFPVLRCVAFLGTCSCLRKNFSKASAKFFYK